MTGKYRVRVSNAKIRFDFEIKRNITVVRGNSGTGKTTLYDMIAEHMRLQDKSGVNISCDVPCEALTDMDWKHQLSTISGSIIFIDEGADYIVTEEFAATIKGSDNYYVFFVRENLHLLPYSVDEIYEFKTSGKFHRLTPLYKAKPGHIYGGSGKDSPDTLLTEDSGAGYQFYEAYFDGSDIQCVSAGGNSSIFGWLQKHKAERVVVVADGAAFGAEMDRVMKLQKQNPDRIRICLPESFEWMILSSGLIKTESIADVIGNPNAYVESRDYFSWEQFFTDYLVRNTENTPFSYSKKRINSVYLIKANGEKIVAVVSLV